MIEALKDTFSIIAATVSFFAIFDAFCSTEHKNRISWYIFGFGNTGFREFERNLITGLVNFILYQRPLIRFLRLYAISVALFFLTMCLVYYITAKAPSVSGFFADFSGDYGKGLLIFLFFPLFSVPFDYFSYLVTDRIFVRKQRKLRYYPALIFFDLVVSYLPFIFLLVVFSMLSSAKILDPDEKFQLISAKTVFMLIFIGSLAGSISIIFVSVIQVLAMLTGLLARGLSGLLHVNQLVAMNSEVHRFPFAFIGLLFSLVLVAAAQLGPLLA
ncbi:MAG: hypothetical protein KDE03_03765 [Rhodobacteraceae bacterium]|nr:hypothetical protein [Paracoccaceae bacterium]